MSVPDINQLRGDAKAGKPEAQFLLSQICFKNKDLEGMIHWLRLASDNGVPVALEMLGYCHEKGRGVARNFDAAIQYYDRAIRLGAHRAGYLKAELQEAVSLYISNESGTSGTNQ